ncbi:MAG: hypothetical protein CMJ53_06225 [Planctomycetaceae bacterium]|mgnify:CR=1 FL=1|nr:hypothetical protein [Planctomycetaceae bacterium]
MGNDGTSIHYDEAYFAWQSLVGRFGGKANAFKFSRSVKPTDTVIDFGCGGGFLLKEIECARRIGIEPNTSAHDQITANDVRPFGSQHECLAELGEGIADVIISNHALEHSLNPMQEIKALMPLLKKGGTMHFLVPCDNISVGWKPGDMHFHLYSWSPMNLGNLFTEAGYTVKEAGSLVHKWPPGYLQIQKIFGWKLFHLCCRLYGRLERSWFQSEVIATKQ